MSALSLLLNVLWIVFGGLWMAVGWLIAAVVMAITIIGLPWTRAAIQHRALHAAPVRTKGGIPRGILRHRGHSAPARSALLGNVVWLVLAG